MISWTAQLASVAVAGGAYNATEPGWTMADRLVFIDEVLFWLGLGLAGAAVMHQIIRRGRRPLIQPAPRSGSIPPEFLILPIIAFVLANVASWPVLHRLADEGNAQGAKLAANSVGMIAAAASCWWIARTFFAGGAAAFLFGDRRIRLRVAEGILALLIGLPFCSILYESTVWGFHRFAPDQPLPEHVVLTALRAGNAPPWIVLSLWVGSTVIAPVAEECFFRGLLQTVMVRLTRQPWAAILISALLFGVAHSSQPQAVPALVLLGALLGYLYEQSGSLVGPFTVHALFNLKTLVWQTYGAGL
jgi:membrane protease YdiL (CAAX protease family)